MNIIIYFSQNNNIFEMETFLNCYNLLPSFQKKLKIVLINLSWLDGTHILTHLHL